MKTDLSKGIIESLAVVDERPLITTDETGVYTVRGIWTNIRLSEWSDFALELRTGMVHYLRPEDPERLIFRLLLPDPCPEYSREATVEIRAGREYRSRGRFSANALKMGMGLLTTPAVWTGDYPIHLDAGVWNPDICRVESVIIQGIERNPDAGDR